MKALNRIGDALLVKLVPGITASAGCGYCRSVATRCACKSINFPSCRLAIYYADACGNQCRATRCSTTGCSSC
jgi:hypothetical protein